MSEAEQKRIQALRAEREQAYVERDAAYADRDAAFVVRDAAIERAKADVAVAGERVRVAEGERDSAVSARMKMERAADEKEANLAASVERDAATKERARRKRNVGSQ